MGKVIRASTLVLLFACTAQAGWIHNGSPEPEPTPAPASAPGYIQNETPAPVESEEAPAVNDDTQNDLTGALAQAALYILNSGMLSLL